MKLASLLTILLSLIVSCSAEATGEGPLRIAILPDEDQAQIFKDYQPLIAHIEQSTGRKVELVRTTSYQAMVEAMRGGRLEVGYFGPLSYCIARNKANLEPFAAKISHGSTTYTSVLLVKADSPYQSPEDLRGKTVGFGDPASTSSHLFPKAILATAGLTAKIDYEEQFLGKHDAVAQSVQNGHVDAGGLSEPILASLIAKGSIDASKVRILARSEPIIQYPWAMRADLSPATATQLREAILGFKDPSALAAMRIEGFAPVSDQDYDGIRKVATLLDLNLTKFDE